MKLPLIIALLLAVVLASGCAQQPEPVAEEQYVPLTQEISEPLCTDGVCYVEDSGLCPEGYIYEHHPIHGNSCRKLCLESREVTFVPAQIIPDTSPFPCYCRTEWSGSYTPEDVPQKFTCEVE